ncbi:hypothetical protein WICMUC_001986 [Wickerhamomyces mucosus]|uniref:BSD domain-containing protein n=1 Tax=Wickerhamomyces mucosus TaxID=1378264 RepID=A0A9P8TF66_9ASCO|nr:hypothetical protein WICMUC_001986 [Wickerhamomyces mucosus]
MSLISGAATYKKKSGLVTIYEDRSPSILQWRAADNEVEFPSVEMVLSTITQMKATPATSEVMKLMIITKASEGAEPVNYVFTFGNRLVMDNVKDALQQIVARYKSAAQATQFVNDSKEKEKPLINTTFLDDALDTKKLLKNHQLQQKLLLDDKTLMATFKEAVMKQGLDPQEFWTTRVHLLRAFALSNSQKRGPYNVLSTIKPTATSDNQVNVSVTREKIHAIFEQYPVVRKAYDDNVPRLSEGEFWSRFFSSKLFRKLRGEKVATNVRGDFILDKYISMDVDYEEHEDEQLNHKVNKIIDLEGNQEDDPSKLGNAPDMTMKPNAVPETVSVLRSMNRLSQKMMMSLEHEYSRAATPESKSKEAEEDEKIRQEMQFADLETPQKIEYMEIHVKQEGQKNPDQVQSNGQLSRQQYADNVRKLKRSLEESPIELLDVFNEKKKPHIEAASKEIIHLVKTNAKQSKQSWHIYRSLEEQSNHEVVDEIDNSFDKVLLEQLRITHATSVEFLRHFWLHFSSGDEKSINQIKSLSGSLAKSIERIKVVTDSIQDPKIKEQSAIFFKPTKDSLTNAILKYNGAVKESSNGSVL